MRFFAVLAFGAILAVACGKTVDGRDHGSPGEGGTASTGGTTNTGGSFASGGTSGDCLQCYAVYSDGILQSTHLGFGKGCGLAYETCDPSVYPNFECMPLGWSCLGVPDAGIITDASAGGASGGTGGGSGASSGGGATGDALDGLCTYLTVGSPPASDSDWPSVVSSFGCTDGSTKKCATLGPACSYLGKCGPFFALYSNNGMIPQVLTYEFFDGFKPLGRRIVRSRSVYWDSSCDVYDPRFYDAIQAPCVQLDTCPVYGDAAPQDSGDSG